MATFRAEWQGLKESFDFIERLGVNAERFVGRGVGRAALLVQEDIRNHLENMVYSQPSPRGYNRTHTLMRSVHASRPDAEHGGDEARARGGQDLAASSPDDVVGVSGSVLMSEVGSWISYAMFVHEGINQPQPRPFVGGAVPAAETTLEVEIMKVILEELARAPHV